MHSFTKLSSDSLSQKSVVRIRNRFTVRDDFLNIAVIFSSVNVFGFFLGPNTNLDQN
jgi:hypothetical protein